MASKDREVWEHHHEDDANAKSERANFNNIGIENSIMNNGADRATMSKKSVSRSGGDDDESSQGAMTGDDRLTDHAWASDRGQKKNKRHNGKHANDDIARSVVSHK